MSVLPVNDFGAFVWFICGLVAVTSGFIIKHKVVAVTLIVFGGLIVGLWRAGPITKDVEKAKSMVGEIVEIVGKLPDDPSVQKSGEITFKLDDVLIDGQKIRGSIWVSLKDSRQKIERSDTVKLEGKLKDGFGNFSASLSNATLEEIAKTSSQDYGLKLRNSFSKKTSEVIAEPEASLGLGFLVGQKNDLPTNLLEALKIAGLTHVIVASGYNLTILVRLARRLFEKVSKYMSAMVSVFMIVGFIGITGWSPSMVRAGLVALLSLAVWYYGRKIHPVALISFAAMLTVMYRPSYAWGDLGWQLSFLAFVGVLILAPILKEYFFKDKENNLIVGILVETFSAFIMTLPLIAYNFGTISTVAIFANLMILPLIPLAMLLTFTSGLISFVSIWLAGIFGWLTYQLLHYMVYVSSYFASLSWSQVNITFGSGMVLFWYMVVVAIIFYFRKVTSFRFDEVNLVK